MTSHDRDRIIDDLSNRVEIILKKSIEWQLIPHSKFALRPLPESWSANECLQHLNSYGRYYLPAIDRVLSKSQTSESSNQFSPGWLGNYFTKLMMPEADGTLSKKMHSPSDHSPKTIIETHLVISEFIDQQEKLLQLLRMAKKIDLNKNRVGISIAPFIKLKLGDVFMFLIAHIVRHTHQAERALEKTEPNVSSVQIGL